MTEDVILLLTLVSAPHSLAEETHVEESDSRRLQIRSTCETLEADNEDCNGTTTWVAFVVLLQLSRAGADAYSGRTLAIVSCAEVVSFYTKHKIRL